MRNDPIYDVGQQVHKARADFEQLCQTTVQWRMANSLLLATIIRIGLVVLSYGCAVPAGIFIPSMAIGATFGRMLGIIVKAVYRYVLQVLPESRLS